MAEPRHSFDICHRSAVVPGDGEVLGAASAGSAALGVKWESMRTELCPL